ncbi:MAG: hypothetical protein HC936_16600 [Leptolyngbyaceae cyanobacterium SU_3_3]|nr:hypothetical protein [Leptolyngbyaceae cyanobacterium SU_3_3]
MLKQKLLVDELDLRIGLLLAQQDKVNQATKTWDAIGDRSTVASTLSGLWSDPPRLLPTAEAQIQKTLNGWFRYRALTKLYQLQQRSQAVSQLQVTEQAIAQRAFFKWAGANLIPTVLGFSGLSLLIFLIWQWVSKGKQALLSGTDRVTWESLVRLATAFGYGHPVERMGHRPAADWCVYPKPLRNIGQTSSSLSWVEMMACAVSHREDASQSATHD